MQQIYKNFTTKLIKSLQTMHKSPNNSFWGYAQKG